MSAPAGRCLSPILAFRISPRAAAGSIDGVEHLANGTRHRSGRVGLGEKGQTRAQQAPLADGVLAVAGREQDFRLRPQAHAERQDEQRDWRHAGIIARRWGRAEFQRRDQGSGRISGSALCFSECVLAQGCGQERKFGPTPHDVRSRADRKARRRASQSFAMAWPTRPAWDNSRTPRVRARSGSNAVARPGGRSARAPREPRMRRR